MIPPKVLGVQEPERESTLPPVGMNLRTDSEVVDEKRTRKKMVAVLETAFYVYSYRDAKAYVSSSVFL